MTGVEQKEKELLLDRLKDNTLSVEDAIRLNEVLEDEREEAIEEDNLLRAIVVGGLTASLAYYIARNTAPDKILADKPV